MRFQNPFRFWPERIYSVPTLYGLFPLLITLSAGYHSFFRGSTAHQWFVIAMSLLTVIHLIESSKAVRSLSITPDPDASIFAGIPANVKLLITSQEPVPPLSLSVEFKRAGVFNYPNKRVDLIAPSGLFRYWRVFRFTETACVLPHPRDHGITPHFNLAGVAGDPDELHPIRDPRLLPLRDQRVFQKTGKSLLRTRAKDQTCAIFSIHWKHLGSLETADAFEQISFWIQEIEKGKFGSLGTISLSIDVPFFRRRTISSQSDLREFKGAFCLAAGSEITSKEGEYAS